MKSFPVQVEVITFIGVFPSGVVDTLQIAGKLHLLRQDRTPTRFRVEKGHQLGLVLKKDEGSLQLRAQNCPCTSFLFTASKECPDNCCRVQVAAQIDTTGGTEQGHNT